MLRADHAAAGDTFMVRAGLELVAVGLLLTAVARWTRISVPLARPRVLLASSMPFWVTGLVWLAIQNVDVLILGLVDGPAAVSVYVPILRTVDIAALIQGLFAVYVLPTASALHSSGRHEELRGVYVRTTAIASAITAPLLAVVAVAPDTVVRFLTGASPVDGVAVARILAAAYAINTIFCLGSVVVQAIDDVWELARRWGIVVVLTVGADLVLIPRLGAVGAALGTLIGLSALNMVGAAMLWRRHRMSALDRTVIVPAAAVLAVVLGFAFLWSPTGAIGVAIVGTTVSVVAIIGTTLGRGTRLDDSHVARAGGSRRAES
jgi:O-antigen/teichoic acid export membrane protein